MDWISRLALSMAYLEEHLDQEIDWEQAARLALCSQYQFARTFSLLAGISLSEYVRARRLTRAAQDLQRGEDRVLDVALRYGYASPTAFQRAFVQFHGTSPRHARTPGARLKAYPPMSFQFTIQGGVALQYRMEKRDAFRVVGVPEVVSMVGGENFRRIPLIWDEFPPERFAALERVCDPKHPGTLGLMHMGDRMESMTYWIAVISEATALEPWMQSRTVPAATYAVFETTMKDLQDTTRRIYAEWMPGSGYEHADSDEFELYPPSEDMEDPTYLCEIWVPVVPKRA